MAKLVAPLLATAPLWVRIQTSLKNNKMGDISKNNIQRSLWGKNRFSEMLRMTMVPYGGGRIWTRDFFSLQKKTSIISGKTPRYSIRVRYRYVWIDTLLQDPPLETRNLFGRVWFCIYTGTMPGSGICFCICYALFSKRHTAMNKPGDR